MSDNAWCRHCGKRIVLMNTLPPMWYHQSAGSSFMDNAHRECHVTVAEPRPKAPQ